MKHLIAPSLLFLVGLLIAAGAFLYFAGNAIPYQDPTPEMLAHQAAEATKAMILLCIGLAMALTGGVWFWRRRRAKA